MDSTYPSDSDSETIIFVTEDGSSFSKWSDLQTLLITGSNPLTGADLTEKDIESIRSILEDGDDNGDENEDSITDEEIEMVDYKPYFKYPYLTMYVMMAIQLGYIMWSVI
jgi:hypothetical protein